MKELPKYKFFCKTDVRDYYSSIDHYTLLMKLHDHIQDRQIINYVWQFLNRCVESGGLYQDVRKGIPRGSSLSPLLGAFYLLDLDGKMERMDMKYFRYMDDILIMAPTRWKLKKAIRALNQTFNELNLEKHPDKTLIGRTERGFDFLGYHFSPEGLGVAKKTVENFLSRAIRLYEQEPGEAIASVRLGEYVQRWVGWTWVGLCVGSHTTRNLRDRWSTDDANCQLFFLKGAIFYRAGECPLRKRLVGNGVKTKLFRKCLRLPAPCSIFTVRS